MCVRGVASREAKALRRTGLEEGSRWMREGGVEVVFVCVLVGVEVLVLGVERRWGGWGGRWGGFCLLGLEGEGDAIAGVDAREEEVTREMGSVVCRVM